MGRLTWLTYSSLKCKLFAPAKTSSDLENSALVQFDVHVLRTTHLSSG